MPTLHLALPHFYTWLLVVIRVAGILAALPFFTSGSVPRPYKIGLVVILGFVILPLVPNLPVPATILDVTGGLVHELLIGLLLGLTLRLMFAAIQLAGELMGIQIGLGASQLFDPQATTNVGILSGFHTLLATLLFLSVNAHFLFVQALIESFTLLPPLQTHVPAAIGDDVMRLATRLFSLAIQLAMPVVAVILTINLVLAILGRAVPQMNVFSLSFPVSILLGLLAIGMALPLTIMVYQHEFLGLQDILLEMMQQIGAR